LSELTDLSNQTKGKRKMVYFWFLIIYYWSNKN